METTSFLKRPQVTLNIVSWNINSIKTKIEKPHIVSFLSFYEIICLNEIKTNLLIEFPGYVTYTSYDKINPDRGGTCVFIKKYLNNFLYSIDKSIPDQIWFRLRCLPGVLFGACYVPPSDSEYFSYVQLSNIQEKVKSNVCSNGVIIIGDMNTRLGVSVGELPGQISLAQYSYRIIPDPVSTPNDNATAMLGICVDEHLLVINNLKTSNMHFKSNKTYRKGREWVSELDTCVVSENIVKCVRSFDVILNNSLPSDHAPIAITLQPPSPCLENLMSRASDLGKHGAELISRVTPRNRLFKHPVKFQSIDRDMFLNKLDEQELPMIIDDNFNATALFVSNTLYDCAYSSRANRISVYDNENNYRDRWDRIMDEHDPAKIWRAINWRGEISDMSGDVDSKPTDDVFKNHFHQVLNTTDMEYPDFNELRSEVSIPVLDEPMTTDEVYNKIVKLKPNKGSGVDGVPPGIFKYLPANWIIFLTTLFNSLFLSGSYPDCWTSAKLFTIFKKGTKSDPNNYRGINVINTISKIYDMVLAARLSQWFIPYREQAGSQVGRGCTEHIVTLRLLMDVARRKKIKLFITFVDFSKAYDCVPRYKLFYIMKQMGCGVTMLMALIAMYRCTNSVIGTALVTATVGVRQGSPTSCILFVLYVNVMIQMIKQGCPLDGFLSWLHVLVMMDDTILLATTKDDMKNKIKIMYDFCNLYGMKVNNSKTKFMVINGTSDDKQPIIHNNISIDYCKQYIYLGSPFTDDANPSTSIKAHAKLKICHALKFISFINKNNDIPFSIKKKVFDAAMMSAMLYGCESWMNGDLKPIEKLYRWCIKQLLGVRKTTTNDMCLVELGMPPLRALIKAKQRKFFKKIWRERGEMNDDPLIYAMQVVCRYNDSISRYIIDMTTNDRDDVKEAQTILKTKIINSISNRLTFYKSVNPNLNVHEIYTSNVKVNEIERISWTRLRLSAHSLAIERGRWNRRGRGRLPVEERLCPCGQIQTEAHIIKDCLISLHIRQLYNITSVDELMLTRTDYSTVCTIIHKLLSLY